MGHSRDIDADGVFSKDIQMFEGVFRQNRIGKA